VGLQFSCQNIRHMKKIFVATIVVVVLLGGYFFLRTSQESISNSMTIYSNQELGLEFDYEAGPNGYVLQEMDPAENTNGLLKTLVLIQTEDQKTLEENGAPVGGEGPATITINVFSNLKERHPSVWAMENISYSNYNLKVSDETEEVVGGANAVRYMADGLYSSENFVIAHGGLIYVFTGMYIDENSDLRKDFSPLVESVKFIPTSNI